MKVDLSSSSGTFEIAYTSDLDTRYDIETFNNKAVSAGDVFRIFANQGDYWGSATSFHVTISFE